MMRAWFAATLLAASLQLPAWAADLVIALGADVTSVDPHVLNAAPNNSIGEQVFDTLVRRDARQRFTPGLAESWRTVDNANRERLLRDATELAINDQAVVPLHYQVNTWAARKGYAYTPRTDERTYAHEVKPQRQDRGSRIED